MFSSGEKWKKHRAVIEPALNTSMLSEYFLNIFNRHCYELIQTLKQEEEKTIDLFQPVFKAEIASVYGKSQDTYGPLQAFMLKFVYLLT